MRRRGQLRQGPPGEREEPGGGHYGASNPPSLDRNAAYTLTSYLA